MKVLIKATHGKLPLPGQRMKFVPDDGLRVDLDGPDGAFWRRRINAGDAVVVKNSEVVAQKPATTAKTKGK